MAYGTVNVRLRPIKLAFLVHPKDKASLLKAIEINTFLWGGIYNPIIPTYRRLPSTWEDRRLKSRNLDAPKALSGYLDNFDPDYVVPMGEYSSHSFDVGNRRTIDDVEDILEPVKEHATPKYGIGLFEISRYLIEQELRFQRKHPLDICIPRFGSQYRTFFASVFGQFTDEIDTIFWEHYAETLEAKISDCAAYDYTEFFKPQKLFLARMTSLYLEPRHHHERRILLLDATKGLDIMDYWNLRAVGWNVIPLPKQLALSDKTIRPTLEFIRANYRPNDSSPKVYNNLTLKSRSISEDEHQLFRNSLATFQSEGTYREPRVVIPAPYPRIWDERAREWDHVESCEIEVETEEHDISTDQDTIRFKTLDPKFMKRFGGHGEARFANEIDLTLYDDKELLAEVIPEGGRELTRVIGRFGILDWRLSRKGLVYLSRHQKRRISLTLPKAEAVVAKWLNLRGWKVELSPAGRIAKQMIRQLGGINGTWTLAKKGIIQLLEEMNSGDGKSISEADLHGTIARIANQTDSKRMGRIIFRELIEKKAFQFGLEIQCPVCTKHSWYSVKNADYELQCSECLAEFTFPPISKDVKWSYRTLGPFSSTNQADGAYTVLLTLRFFSDFSPFDSATTPLMSFKAKRKETELEADLALFFQASRFRDSKTQLIFAECKTFNDFGKKDTHRMRQLGEAFPGAVIVFATLKECLSQKEKDILQPLVMRSRKNWKANRPFNPVMILTGKELFLESVWDSHLEGTLRREDLLELCDATQRINMGMRSRYQWLDEQTGRISSVQPTTWTRPNGETVRSAD